VKRFLPGSAYNKAVNCDQKFVELSKQWDVTQLAKI